MKDIKILVRKYTLQLLDLRNDVSSYLALNGILEETKLNVVSFVKKLNNLQSIYAEIMLYDYIVINSFFVIISLFIPNWYLFPHFQINCCDNSFLSPL